MQEVKEISITKDHSLKSALELLEKTGKAILLLVDNNGILQQTITDGDIRRLLLSGKELDDNLVYLKPSKSVTVGEAAAIDEIIMLMDTHGVNQVPVVDVENKPVGIYLRREIQPRIQLSIPHIGDYERQYVEEAFKTNWIAPLGPNVDAFEEEIADYVGAGHAAALSSGTAAIHLALRLLEVNHGDVVLCSSFTFVASANPILYQGAIPVFIDSEPNTWNMSPVALEKALKVCCEKGKRPKAIIVVHLFGQSAEMEKIMALSEQYGVPIVEDAAESLGSSYKGKHTGTFGKFGIFSFNGNKIITTSGGGMLVSDDEELVDKARFLSTQARDSSPYYEHSEVGYNYRMSNVLAGIGRGQLKVLEERVAARRKIFSHYKESLEKIDCIEWMPEPEADSSNRWLSALFMNPSKTKATPKQLIEALENYNVEARYVWKPMHLQPLFTDAMYFSHYEDKSYSDILFEHSVCLPSASNMTLEQQHIVIKSLLEFFDLHNK